MTAINEIEEAPDSHDQADEVEIASGGRSRLGTNKDLKRRGSPLKILFPIGFLLIFVGGGYFVYHKYRAEHLAALGVKSGDIDNNKGAAGQSSSSRRFIGVDATSASPAVGSQGGATTSAPDAGTQKPQASVSGQPAPLSNLQGYRQSGPGQPLQPGQYVAVDPNAPPQYPRSRFDSPLVMQDGLASNGYANNASSQGQAPLNVGSNGFPAAPALPAFPDLSKLITQQNGQAAPAAQGAFGNQLTPSKTPKVMASTLGNRSLVLPKGRSIDCVLDTAFSSDAPSLLSCTVTKNIFSDDGKVVLIDKGSKATGESGTSLKQGQSRVFILWTRIRTPTGVIIDLDSPGADALGRGGITGEVDTHFMERFGTAFLVSMFQDAFAYGIAKTSTGSNSTNVIQNTQSTGNSLATEIVRNSIGIAPTLQKNQGERVSIMVARDLDFSTVYDLKAD